MHYIIITNYSCIFMSTDFEVFLIPLFHMLKRLCTYAHRFGLVYPVSLGIEIRLGLMPF